MAADPAGKAVEGEIDRRISATIAALRKGEIPSADDATELERLFRVRDFLARRANRNRPRWEAVLLAVLALTLAILLSIHLWASPAELAVKATRIALTLTRNHSGSLLPGEMGEVLGLRSAEIVGADRVDPANAGRAGTVILKPRALTKAPLTADQPPVLLQEVFIPGDAECKMVIGVAYDVDLHGLTLESSGAQPTSALLSMPAADAGRETSPLKHVITVEGNHLNVRIFPAEERPLTVFRNTLISQIRFDMEDAKNSSVLGGKVIMKEKPGGPVVLDPGDPLTIVSDEPMSLRELTLRAGELTARIAVPHALKVGVGPKELMPTLFDWIYYRWPTQVYGCACALAALWLTLRKWWTNAA